MSSLENMYTAAVMFIGRTIHRIRFTNDGRFPRGEYGGTQRPTRVAVKDVEQANLVSSLIKDDIHAPAIDLDFPAHLIPSTTPGHFHLYIEKEMRWRDYRKLLDTLLEVGLIDKGWHAISVQHEQTYLRLPHVKKEVDHQTPGFMDDY